MKLSDEEMIERRRKQNLGVARSYNLRPRGKPVNILPIPGPKEGKLLAFPTRAPNEEEEETDD